MYGHWLPFVESKLHLDDKMPRDSVSQNENGAYDKLASATSFKFQKEPRQGVGKYRWNRYISWMFFVQNFLFIYATSGPPDADLCTLGLHTPGRTWPSGDILLEYGQPLRIYCILNDNLTDPIFRGRNASDLVFFRSDKAVEPEYITVINETTSMLYVDRPAPSADMYFCSMKLNDGPNRQRYKAVCLNAVTIAFKPEQPLDFSCVSYNWEKLVCTWKPAPNYIDTRFSLGFRLPGRAGRSMFQCPVPRMGSDFPPNTCIWDTSSHPHYRQAYEYFTFILTAENGLGTNRFTYGFHHWAHVIPAKPDNLSIVNKTASSALLHWSVPRPIATFPPGLHHRVSYRNERDSRDNWQTLNITNQKHSCEIYFNLTDLQHANAVYTVRVSMKSSVANDEDKWSQFSEVSFRTAPTLPGLPPRTDIGSFEITRNSDSRDVYIYWQAIPEYLENGDNFTYRVVRVEENGRILDLQPHEITETYAEFKGVSLNSLTFDIVATNCEGANEHKATVRVPCQMEMPQKPVVFTKIAFDGGIYELSWNLSSNSDIIDCTIFWCENDRDRPYQCSGYLDWVHVPQNTSIYNITVPDPSKVYQFAITANTAEASSGMAWFSSMTTLSSVVGKIKSVWTNHVESDLIQIGWEIEYSGRIGTIESYNIHYCPIVSSNNFTCDGPGMITSVTSAPHTLHGVIRNLRPHTTYSITVAAVAKSGEGLHSNALYVTTLKTALDSVSNSSEPIDTLLQTAVILSDVSVSTEIGQRSLIANDLVGEIKRHCDGDVDCRQDQIDRLNSISVDCISQAKKLTQTIHACEKKLNSLLDQNHQLRDRGLGCNEIW